MMKLRKLFPEVIDVAGHELRQLSRTDFEGENHEQDFDFYFRRERHGITVHVFDSKIEDPDAALVTTFSADTLKNAVLSAFGWSR